MTTRRYKKAYLKLFKSKKKVLVLFIYYMIMFFGLIIPNNNKLFFVRMFLFGMVIAGIHEIIIGILSYKGKYATPLIGAFVKKKIFLNGVNAKKHGTITIIRGAIFGLLLPYLIYVTFVQ